MLPVQLPVKFLTASTPAFVPTATFWLPVETLHPARFPKEIPDFFISFLTDKGDLVYDPFGGSCVTGKSSEDKQREWICSEINEEYLKGAKSRFIDWN